MVGILAFEFEPIKRKSLLKSLKGITQRLCKKNAINPADIGLMVHTGTYRQNFRQEPAFAAHLQQALDIGCANIGPTSKHTFSFDVSDGACGPHHALETIADLFPVIGCKYALLTAGDCRPNKETPWPHKPISFAAIISEDGPLQILDTRFDYEQENDFTSSTKFNKKYHTEAFTSKPHSRNIALRKTASSPLRHGYAVNNCRGLSSGLHRKTAPSRTALRTRTEGSRN